MAQGLPSRLALYWIESACLMSSSYKTFMIKSVKEISYVSKCNPTGKLSLERIKMIFSPVHHAVQSTGPVHQSSPPVQSTGPVHQSSSPVQSTGPVHRSSPLVQFTSPVYQSSPPVQSSDCRLPHSTCAFW